MPKLAFVIACAALLTGVLGAEAYAQEPAREEGAASKREDACRASSYLRQAERRLERSFHKFSRLRDIRELESTVDKFSRLPFVGHRPTVDKSSLSPFLREPAYKPVHIFFPIGKTKLESAFDWQAVRRDQLRGALIGHEIGPDLRIFVFGSTEDTDSGIAIERIRQVISFMSEHFNISLRHFRAAWAGSQITWSSSDARFMNIEPIDYRSDERILNESVQVFISPCISLSQDHSATWPPTSPTAVENLSRTTEANPLLELRLGLQLRRVQEKFHASRGALKIHSKGGANYYEERSLEGLIGETKRSTISELGGTKLRALRSYAEEEFAILVGALDPVECCSSTSLLSSTPMKFDRNGARSTLVEVKRATPILDGIAALLSRLTKASQKLTLKACIISYPEGANFSLHPKKDSRNKRIVATNSLISDLWIGRYSYQVQKSGFKTVAFDFDFLDESSSVIECRLVADGAEDIPLACQAGKQSEIDQCKTK